MNPDVRNIETTVEEIWGEQKGNAGPVWELQKSAPHSKQALWVKLDKCPRKMDILRRQGA